MNYPYENLGPDLFQEFVQSLLLEISPNVACYPVGQADGGRDATVPEKSQSEFIVYQVKYERDPSKVKDPSKWLEKAISKEMDSILSLFSRGAKYYYLVTNVSGTAKKDSGSMDKINRIFDKYELENCQCIWRDDLDRRLDRFPDLRWAYPTLITGMDVLKLLIETGFDENQRRRSLSIKAFLRTEFQRDEKVRFKQVDLQNDLLKLFVDVPITPLEVEDESSLGWRKALISSVAARQKVIDEEDERHISIRRQRWSGYPETVGTAQFLLDKTVHLKEPVVIIEGGPGQGKSTLTQYISQVHRARLLEESVFLQNIKQEHLEQPVKLPFRIDLRDLSTWLERKNPFYNSISPIEAGNWAPTVEAFLASQIAAYSGGTSFSVDDFYAVVNISHILMIFDGLDEVPDISQRHKVVDAIIDSITRIKQTAISLQSIVTTRPAAFSNAPGFPKSKYPTYKLGYVNRGLAKEYAKKWAASKALDEQDSEDLFKILDEKLSLPHLEDLSKNPMQLTILLSLIHSRGISLPDKRTSLYDRYVDLFFNRESEKSSIIREHRELVIGIHQYIAWILHAESEKGSQGRVDHGSLISILKKYLNEEGHNPDLVDSIFTGLVERVVFLVSRIEGTFEFEIQPLREYFAGRFLYDTAPYSPTGEELSGTLPDRFDGLCRNFYWLNCVRFFSGCYSKGELHSLIDRVEGLFNDDRFKYLAHPRDLAVLLLSDWVFSQYPKSVSKIVDLLFSHGGIRFLGAGVSRNPTIFRNSITLPSQCGREQLVERCVEELRKATKADYSSILTGIIHDNCSSDEIFTISGELIESNLCDQKLNLRYISDIEGFNKFSSNELDVLEERYYFSAEFYESVSRSARNEYIFDSEVRLDRAFRMYMDGNMNFRSSPGPETSLETLLFVLEPGFFDFLLNQSANLASDKNQSLNEFLEGLMGCSFEHGISRSQSYTSTKINKLIEVLRAEFNKPLRVWQDDFSPYVNVIDALYHNFGYSYRLVQISCVASGVKNKKITCKESSDLFESNRPLIERMRYARLRSGSIKWWSSVFDSKPSSFEKYFAIISFFFWATNRVFLKKLFSFNEFVNDLDYSDFYSLVKTVNQYHRLYDLSDKKISLNDDLESLSENLNSGVLAMLALRMDRASKISLCSLIVDGYKFSSVYEWSIVMDVMIGCLGNKAEGLQSQVLMAISICYENCNGLTAFDFRYHMFASDSSLISNVEDARYIIDNIYDFPVLLVRHAEATCRNETSKLIKPVLDVSSSEHWFSTELDGG